MNRFAKRQLRLEMLEDRRLLSVQPLAAPPVSNDHIVTPSVADQTVAPGDPVSFDIDYSTDPVATNSTGFGLKMFYDSSVLTNFAESNLFGEGVTLAQRQVQEDVDDDDGDPNTDQFFLTAWFHMGSQWPGFSSADVQNLYTANFTAEAGATGSTTVNFIASSVASGWTFLSTPVTINFNQPPVAEAGGPYAVDEAGTVVLDASGSSDPDQIATSLTYEWDLDGDGTFGEAGEVGIAPTFSALGLDGPATSNVTLRVTDDAGVSTEDTAVVNVANVAPVVDAGVGAATDVGVAFTGAGSFIDPGADAWTASVDYGDGSAAENLALAGKTFALNHTYAAVGDYTVTVTVNDGTADGADQLTVSVTAPPNTAPVVYAGSDAAAGVGVAFTGAGSFVDPDADTWAASVDYGDGSAAENLTLTGKTFALNHTYAAAGVYTVTVTVNDGTADGADDLAVTVSESTNTAPVVNAGSDAAAGVGVAFTGTGLFVDPDADAWTASVDYGDGSGLQQLPLTGKTFSLNHVYTTAGVYTVTVSVDDGTDTDSDELSVTVAAGANTAPIVNAGSDAAAGVGVAFTGTGLFVDPDADTWTASVDYGDGSAAENLTLTGKAFSLNHVYTATGDYTVTVTVDDGTDTGSDALSVSVSDISKQQIVTPTPGVQTVSPGGQVSFDLMYSTNPPSTNTTGLGMKMFYDSSMLTNSGATNLLEEGLVQDQDSLDTGDEDGDPLTDRFFLTGWASTGTQWPNFVAIPTPNLYTANFTASAGASGSTTVRFMDTSVGSGWTFASTPVVVNIASGTNVAPVVFAGDDTSTTLGVAFSGTGTFVDPDTNTWTGTVGYGDGSAIETLSILDKTFNLSHVYTATGDYTVTVTISDGVDSGVDTFLVSVPGNLGTVDFLELPNQNPSADDLLYEMKTTRSGFLTLEASNATATLTLFDSTMTPVATSSPASGHSRIDYQAAAAGETYFLELSDSSSDVGLRLTNLVSHVGSEVTVAGTSGIDDFTSLSDASTCYLTINAVEYEFDLDTMSAVHFDGGLGDDTAVLTGTSGDDSFETHPGSIEMTSLGLSVEALNTPIGVLHSGGGTNDVALLYDSDGDDTATLDFDEAHLSGTSLAGQSYSVDAYDFDFAYAYGQAGGHDVATLTGTTTYDKLKGTDEYTMMRHLGAKIRAKYFEEVVAHSLGGNDVATLRDSTGDEHMEAWPDRVTYSGNGFHEDIRGFHTVIGYGRNGGHDSVVFHDSPGDDIFRGLDIKSHLYSLAPDGSRVYDIVVRDFEESIVTATTGFDKARLFDSIGDDIFTGHENHSTMIGPNVNVTADGFDRVDVAATQDGNDQAFLFDTPGNDNLIADAYWAKLYGPDSSIQYLFQTYHFESLDVSGQSGGTNTKDIGTTDYLLQLIDPGDWI